MNCDPQSLMEQAKCFRCIPGGNVPSVITYLMCQWASGPAACQVAWTPAASTAGWQDINGADTGDLAYFLANADMATVSSMDFSIAGNLTSISCLRALPALTVVDANSNVLTSIDVVGCSLLNNLNVSGNQLTSLNLTGCSSLVTLTADTNNIGPTIDFSPCPALFYAYLSSNQLTSLNFLGNPALLVVDGTNNLLTSINVTNCPNLDQLYLGQNPIASVDLSGNPILTVLVTDTCPNLLSLDLTIPILIVTISTVNCTSLASVNATGALGMTGVNLQNCALNDAALDSFLSQMAGGCQGNAGIMDLTGAGNGKPTGGMGNPDVVLLVGGGWAVSLNP